MSNATKPSRFVRSARKRTGHVFEKIRPIALGSSTINRERPRKTRKMLLPMTKMQYLPFRKTELQTQ
jgi:hypothetical protein